MSLNSITSESGYSEWFAQEIEGSLACQIYSGYLLRNKVGDPLVVLIRSVQVHSPPEFGSMNLASEPGQLSAISLVL